MKSYILAIAAAAAIGSTASAQLPDHINIHYNAARENFKSIYEQDLDSIMFHDTNSSGTFDEMWICYKGGSIDKVPVSELSKITYTRNVPEMFINLTGTITGDTIKTHHPEYAGYDDLPSVKEQSFNNDKEIYFDCTVQIRGNGYVNYLDPTPCTIKGRGNSTWTFEKKPYRLKFPKKDADGNKLDKINIGRGLKKARSFALIANYIDCTNMRNSIAMKIGELLDMPFTNHMVPCRLYINGHLRGSYMITEKIGIGSESIDINEDWGITYSIENGQAADWPMFGSETYGHNVEIKDYVYEDNIPDNDWTNPHYLAIKALWNKMEASIATEDKWKMIDMNSLVNYLIVGNLCNNPELNYPKSMKMYVEAELLDQNGKRLNGPAKPVEGDTFTPDGIFHFGPIWDYDWAFNFTEDKETMETATLPLFAQKVSGAGTKFFKDLADDPVFLDAYDTRWNEFKESFYPMLKEYIEELADEIELSTVENGILWPDAETGVYRKGRSSFKFRENLEDLKKWLDARVEFISTDPNHGLW